MSGWNDALLPRGVRITTEGNVRLNELRERHEERTAVTVIPVLLASCPCPAHELMYEMFKDSVERRN